MQLANCFDRKAVAQALVDCQYDMQEAVLFLLQLQALTESGSEPGRLPSTADAKAEDDPGLPGNVDFELSILERKEQPEEAPNPLDRCAAEINTPADDQRPQGLKSSFSQARAPTPSLPAVKGPKAHGHLSGRDRKDAKRQAKKQNRLQALREANQAQKSGSAEQTELIDNLGSISI